MATIELNTKAKPLVPIDTQVWIPVGTKWELTPANQTYKFLLARIMEGPTPYGCLIIYDGAAIGIQLEAKKVAINCVKGIYCADEKELKTLFHFNKWIKL